MPDIVAVGEGLVEIMRTGRDQPLDTPGPFIGPYPSGAPAIFADAVARLGGSAGFVGTVGTDDFGDCLVRRLETDGVDCRALCREPSRLTGIAFVAYRSDGSRHFVFHLRDAAASQVSLEQIPAGWLDDVRYAHIMGSSLSGSPALRDTCYAVATAVAEQGGIVSLDPNLRPELVPEQEIQALCEPVLARARIVFPSGAELTALTGEPAEENAIEQLLERGVEIIALKRGERGSSIYTSRGRLDLAPYTIVEVDPTGAGDCYDAAFIVGHSKGWDLERVGRFANAAGALATTRQGPMEGTPTRVELLEFMRCAGRPL